MPGLLQFVGLTLCIGDRRLRIGAPDDAAVRAGLLQVDSMQLRIGLRRLRIGPADDAPSIADVAPAATMANWVISVPDHGLYLWTGHGTLLLDGQEYMGAPGVLSVSGFSADPDGNEESASVELILPTTSARQTMLQDFGPKQCIITQVFSKDFGTTWRRVPRRFVGRLSGPVVSADKYKVDVVSRKYDIDRGETRHWPTFPILAHRRLRWPQ